MKRVLFFLLAILLITGVAYAGTDILGQGGLQSDPGKIFRVVRYVPLSGSAISETLTAESLVIWDTTSDDGITVIETETTRDAAVAGIVPFNILTPDTGCLGNTVSADIGRRNWGLVQTYGKAQATFTTGGAAVVKSGFGASGTGRQAGQCGLLSSDLRCAGFALDAGSGGNIDVFLIND